MKDSGRAAAARGPALDRWLEAVPEAVFRRLGILCFGVFLAVRLTTRQSYSNQILFLLEAAIPGLILAAYLTRTPARRRARGTAGILLPFFCSVLPFGMGLSPMTPFGKSHQVELFALMCVPTATMIWSYLTLSRSFGIMAEARELKLTGPYRIVRHPAYTSQIAVGLVLLVLRGSWLTALVFVTFVLAQNRRAAAEEEVLAAEHPAYREYRERTPRFLPFFPQRWA